MSLIGLVKQAIAGQATWTDVENKVESLAETGALDVFEAAESLASAFWTKFAPAEAQSLESDVPGIVSAATTSGVGAALSEAGSEALTQTESNAESAAASAVTSAVTPPAPTTGQ